MEQLTKVEFIELDIEKKIQYLNDRLSQGQTVIRIREDLGIGEKTLQKIMKKNGYKYNQKERLYKKSTDVENIVSSSEKSLDKEIYKSSIPVERHTNGSNPEVESKIYNSREIVVDKEKFNLMLKSYKKVEQMAEKLDAVYRWYEKEHEVIDVTPQELKIDKFEGEAVSRAYKFYPDIQKDFIEFCDRHKQYKKQDIICQALKEFMEKYKNSKG